MSPRNPYAPPRGDSLRDFAAPAPALSPPDAADIAEALRRLNAHVSDPRNLLADRTEAGARVRIAVLVALGLGVLGLGLGVAGREMLQIAGYILGGLFAFVGAIALLVDLTLRSRTVPDDPDKTLKHFFVAVVRGRYGYAWTCLSPTAREQTVATPDLAPVDTEAGRFRLGSTVDLKAYVQSFARSSGPTVRVMQVRKIAVESVQGDVARVRAELRFQSFPQWINVAGVVLVLVFRPLFLVLLVVYFVLRKRRTVSISKTLLRASNGVWYLLDGALVEGAMTR